MNYLYKKLSFLFAISITLVSCEDVIEVTTPTVPPKLVIEASINWFKGSVSNNQMIVLSLTAPYFDASTTPANDATVTITDENNVVFNFIEDADTGIYRNSTFNPELNGTYNLVVNYNGETYVSTETLYPVSEINRVEQKDNGGFTGDETELKAFYTDPEGEENYYFFEFINIKNSTIDLEVYDDEFTDGNEIFGYYSEEDISPGDEMIIRLYGVSEQFYEYMFILLQQNNEENGDPFEIQPATIRGNCINITNPENFPLGYFRVSEAHQFNYVIQ